MHLPEPWGVVLPAAADPEAPEEEEAELEPVLERLDGGGAMSSSSSSVSERVMISGSMAFFLLLTSSTMGAVEGREREC